eukprot:scaffold52681_cov69-Phaeocystis_antarctica.AAC.9
MATRKRKPAIESATSQPFGEPTSLSTSCQPRICVSTFGVAPKTASAQASCTIDPLTRRRRRAAFSRSLSTRSMMPKRVVFSSSFLLNSTRCPSRWQTYRMVGSAATNETPAYTLATPVASISSCALRAILELFTTCPYLEAPSMSRRFLKPRAETS